MAEGPEAGLYVGVAVAEYDDDAWETLTKVLPGVKDLADLLDGQGFVSRTVESPTRQRWMDELQSLSALGKNGFEGPLILVWSGHGEVLSDALSLILRDTPGADPGKSQGAYQAGDLVARLNETGSKDSLVIIDTCSAGAADRDLFLAQLRELEETTWQGQGPRLACVVSCKGYERVEDGAFLASLVELIRDGPGDLDLGVMGITWSVASPGIPVQAVFQAIEAAGGDGTHPRTWASGASRITFPNPRYDPTAAAALVEDRLRVVHGRPPRPMVLIETPASAAIAAAVGAEEVGLWVLSGAPGSGKSSCLRTARESLGGGLLILPATDGVDLIGAKIAAVGTGEPVAIDGLDEAPFRERAEIVDLATTWSRDRLVIVTTMSTAADADAEWRTGRLAERGTRTIDLDRSEWVGSAIYDYVRLRLDDEADDA
jgi:hypothetical protein